MDRLSFPGTPSPFLAQPPPPPPPPPPNKDREKTMGDASFTKDGSLASQKIGTRSLLRNKYLDLPSFPHWEEGEDVSNITLS